MLCYKIVRPHDEVIVSIFRNKNDNTYSFINLRAYLSLPFFNDKWSFNGFRKIYKRRKSY